MAGMGGDSIIIIIGGDHMVTIMEIDMVVVILGTDLVIDLQVIIVRVSHVRNITMPIVIELQDQVLEETLGPLNCLQDHHDLVIQVLAGDRRDHQQGVQVRDHQTLVLADQVHVRATLRMEQALDHQLDRLIRRVQQFVLANRATILDLLQEKIMFILTEKEMCIAKIVRAHGRTGVITVGRLRTQATVI